MDPPRQDPKKKLQQLQFQGDDPGAVRFGNFINYYDFHSLTARTSNLPLHFINLCDGDIVSLDLGCNSGDLTLELHNILSKELHNNIIIYGFDLDPILIKRAEEKVENGVHFECLDLMDPTAFPILKSYLRKHNKTRFDVVFCFSLTMWIHLNYGDEGLQQFLNSLLEISEVIVLEPQPWKCYRNALKRIKRQHSDFPLYKTLKLRNINENITSTILNMNSFEKVFESEEIDWGRKILIFKRK